MAHRDADRAEQNNGEQSGAAQLSPLLDTPGASRYRERVRGSPLRFFLGELSYESFPR